MKKIIFCLVAIFAAFVVTNISMNNVVKAESTVDLSKTTTFNGATYQVTERKAEKEIGYGINYINDVSTTNSKVSKTAGGNDPQNVNILEVPSSTVLKVVNWTFSSSPSWSLKTIKQLAVDFEKNNPGWIVLAGINGDFFDINSNYALAKQTCGASVNNGESVRGTSGGENGVGFTNNGTTNSLVGNSKPQFSSPKLAIYDENDDIIKEYDVVVNKTPADNEIAVYYSYRVKKGDGTSEIVKASVPAENSFLVMAPKRCYASDANTFYGKGAITDVNTAKTLAIGYFGISTNNQEVLDLLAVGTTVRVQRNLTGAFADCDNVSGVGQTLIYDGQGVATTNTDRHPRTIIGSKADGTLVLCTVDGRQEAKNMYGVCYDEMTAIMEYYGCTQAYNLDGGGSTTMIIRNAAGNFNVMNSPSDGSERSDANAILVVVPSVNVKVKTATDKTATLTYADPGKGISYKDIEITVKGENYEQKQKMENNSLLWEGLTKLNSYEVYVDYEIEYNGGSIKNSLGPINFKTGKQTPVIKKANYYEKDGNYVFEYEIDDPDGSIEISSINYDTTAQIIKSTSTTSAIETSKVTTEAFKLSYTYNYAATPSEAIETFVEFTKVDAPKDEDPEEPVDPTDPTDPVEPVDPAPKGGCSDMVEGIISMSVLTAIIGVFLSRKR